MLDTPRRDWRVGEEAGVSEAVFRSLERKGWLMIETAERWRATHLPMRSFCHPPSSVPECRNKRHAVDSIKDSNSNSCAAAAAFRGDWRWEDGDIFASDSACY